MSPIQASLAKTKGDAAKRSTGSRKTASAVGVCLLLSSDETLRRRMERAACLADWEPLVCHTAEEAVRQAILQRVGLAVVDVSQPSVDVQWHNDLMRLLRSTPGGLIVVCDRLDNPEGEIWARQQGAWVYLPGTAEQDELILICKDAMNAAEKMMTNGLTKAAVS